MLPGGSYAFREYPHGNGDLPAAARLPTRVPHLLVTPMPQLPEGRPSFPIHMSTPFEGPEKELYIGSVLIEMAGRRLVFYLNMRGQGFFRAVAGCLVSY